MQARRSTWGDRDTDKDLVWGCYDGILPSVPRILNRGWAFYESSISTIFPPANELRYHTQRGHYYTLRTSGPCYRLTMNPRFRQTGTQSSPLRLDDDDNLFVQLPVPPSWLMTRDWDTHAPPAFKRHASVYIFLVKGTVKGSPRLDLSAHSVRQLPRSSVIARLPPQHLQNQYRLVVYLARCIPVW